MDIGSALSLSNPVYRNRLLVIISVTILAVVLNLAGLSYGIMVVLPHLFYIPIILAGYWYPRKGILFSLSIAVLYGLLAFSFPFTDPQGAITIYSRMTIFVIIGAVVSLLSSRLSESEHRAPRHHRVPSRCDLCHRSRGADHCLEPRHRRDDREKKGRDALP